MNLWRPRISSAPLRAAQPPGNGSRSRRADFKYLAVVARLQRDPKLTTAVEFRHHRHHGDDRLASAVVERGLYVRLLAEPDQVAGGRKRQLEPPALPAGQRLARRYPDRIGGLLAVVGAGLLRRRSGEKEPGVEPFQYRSEEHTSELQSRQYLVC